jgi:hypothetical protein
LVLEVRQLILVVMPMVEEVEILFFQPSHQPVAVVETLEVVVRLLLQAALAVAVDMEQQHPMI